jgi:hypothetical protein
MLVDGSFLNRARFTRLRDLLRTANWLNRERAGGYGLILWLTYIPTLGFYAVRAIFSSGGLDFSSYYAAGKLAVAGRAISIYDQSAHWAMEKAVTGNPRFGYIHYFYPPVFLLLCAPLALLPYLPALIAWAVAQTTVFGIAIEKILGTDPARTLRQRALLVFPFLAFPTAMHSSLMGQNALLTASLFAGGGAALAAGRPWLGGLILGCLVYKPHFGLLVPVALLFGRYWRAFLGAVAGAVGLLALSALLFGPDIMPAYLHTFLSGTRGVYGSVDSSTAKMGSVVLPGWIISPYGAVLTLGGGPILAASVQGIFSAAAAILVAVVWRDPAIRIEPKMIVLIGATLLAVPIILWYDELLTAAALAWTVRDARRIGWLPWEKFFFLATFMAQMFGFAVNDLTGVPFGPPIALGVLAFALARARSLAPTASTESVEAA